ncbi:hypothetical protein D9Q98_007762 [Chlorella vulgaris]|uniref:Thioredoxin n=1 Tax=Chlorella vulgaris TaxID=3077 RepID=A0A9D4THJ6_CHLVU|nr:hypothetical protein D9Q98_007762 [Chlorella vulgaris]
MGGKVVIIHSKEEWDAQMSQNDAVFVIDFTATWCGPCRMIGPYFEELSGQYDTVTFLKVDVDEVEAVAAECGISAMPTFQVWKGGKKVEEIVGANKEKLKALVEAHKGAASLAMA